MQAPNNAMVERYFMAHRFFYLKILYVKMLQKMYHNKQGKRCDTDTHHNITFILSHNWFALYFSF